MNCTHCNLEKQAKGSSLPPRWKRLPRSNEPCCPTCWKGRYFMRAVTVPIGGPSVNGNPTEMQKAWEELRTRLYAAWDASTRLANWSVQQLQRLDIVRTAAMEKIPPMPKEIYLYGLFGKHPDRESWSGAAASAQSLMRTVEACWRESRWDVIWNYTASARSYRWPTPFPVHNDSWTLSKSDQGVYSCSLTLPGGRLDLRIRNDRSMIYQRKRLDQLIAGQCVAGEAAIYARVVQGNDRQNGASIRGPGGKQDYRVMLKIAAWFPRPNPIEAGVRSGELLVHTGNDSLLYAEQEGHDIWIYNGDEIRRRVIGHKAMLKRHSDDMKHEFRWPKAMRDQHNEAMQRRVTKHQNFMNAVLHEISKTVAGLAERRKVSTILFDESECGFVPSFPYFDLKRRIEQKTNAVGIDFKEVASGDGMNENPDAAREPEELK